MARKGKRPFSASNEVVEETQMEEVLEPEQDAYEDETPYLVDVDIVDETDKVDMPLTEPSKPLETKSIDEAYELLLKDGIKPVRAMGMLYRDFPKDEVEKFASIRLK